MADRELKIRLVVDDAGAIQKLEQVDKRLDGVTESATKADVALGKQHQTLGKLTEVVGRYVSAAAVGYAIKATVQWADGLNDLAAKTGASITSLQKLESVAKASGGTLEQTAQAITMMADRLGGNDKSAIAAVQKLGLNLEQLKRQDPGQTFIQLATAIGRIEDPYRRAALASDVFGRAGKELLPVIDELAKGLADDIPVASDRSVRALGWLADKVTEYARRAKTAGAEFLGGLMTMDPAYLRGGLMGALAGSSAAAGRAGLQMMGLGQVNAPGVGGADIYSRALATPGLPTNIVQLESSLRDEIAANQRLTAATNRAASTMAELPAYLVGEFNRRLAGGGPSVPYAMGAPAMGSLLLSSSPLPGGGMSVLAGAPSGTAVPTSSASWWSRMGGMFGSANSYIAGIGGLMSLFGGSSTIGRIGGGIASGAGAGAMIGSIVPGLGTAIGGGIGAIVGGIGGALSGLLGPSKGKQEGMAADASLGQLQQQLLATYGSLANIKAMGDLVGVSLAEAWGSKNVAGLEHFKKLMGEFEEKQNRLQVALEKYGLTWEDLGAKAKNFFFQNEAMELLKDFELLTTAGVETDKLLEKMANSFSSLVQTAQRNGLEIPNALRPMLERLLEMGLLLDEAGNKIERLDGLFSSLTIPTITIPVDYVINKPPYEGEVPDNQTEPGYARGGLVYARGGGFMRGTDSILAALTPGEFVLNRDAAQRLGSGRLNALNRGADLGGQQVVVQIDARDSVFDGVSAQRWADRVADKLMQRVAANAPLRTAWT